MITREELLKSSEYWIETIQNKVFNDLSEYIEKHEVSNKSLAESLGLTKGRVSQILSGENLNFRIDTLVRLCLAIDRIPDFRLIEMKDFLEREKGIEESIVFTHEVLTVPINNLQFFYSSQNFNSIQLGKTGITFQASAENIYPYGGNLKVA
jgi:transcriptional regulator with XRE-family HTH domain